MSAIDNHAQVREQEAQGLAFWPAFGLAAMTAHGLHVRTRLVRRPPRSSPRLIGR